MLRTFEDRYGAELNAGALIFSLRNRTPASPLSFVDRSCIFWLDLPAISFGPMPSERQMATSTIRATGRGGCSLIHLEQSAAGCLRQLAATPERQLNRSSMRDFLVFRFFRGGRARAVVWAGVFIVIIALVDWHFQEN